MPRDLRDDTILTADPDRPGRFHGNLPDAWKVVYVFATLRSTRGSADRSTTHELDRTTGARQSRLPRVEFVGLTKN